MGGRIPLQRGILLHSIAQVEGERSFAMVKAVLRGRKTQQTIQDTWYYQLVPCYQLFSPGSARELPAWYRSLLQTAQVEEVTARGRATVRLTAKGREMYERWKDDAVLSPFFVHLQEKNGFLQGEDEERWQTFQLLVQTCSHKMRNSSHFLPIVDRLLVQERVKRLLKGVHSTKAYQQLGLQLREELFQLLQTWSILEQQLLLFRLMGWGVPAHTYQQLAQQFQLHDEVEAELLLRILVARFWRKVERWQPPLLRKLVMGYQPVHLLTRSAQVTYGLLQTYDGPDGQLIPWLAAQRCLKQGTVEDHIVEMACKLPTFSIHPYVGRELEQRIVDGARSLQTKRLALIKAKLGEEVSYFQIRLVLSRIGRIK